MVTESSFDKRQMRFRRKYKVNPPTKIKSLIPKSLKIKTTFVLKNHAMNLNKHTRDVDIKILAFISTVGYSMGARITFTLRTLNPKVRRYGSHWITVETSV